ncbi:MAG: DUF1489 family protein [Alphaproteobacteria bacterium]|nr:DUF1489 family protein [Alphaproteobacteria bacterium]
MTVHLVKLSVGPENLAELAAWQKHRLKELKAKGRKPELIHVTRQTPKRAEELLDGGSIYWVIKGWIVARQKLVELRAMKVKGVPHCGLVLGRKLVTVQPRQRRPFQGWRYLDAKDAPPDSAGPADGDDLPPELRQELAMLGLV